jgi:hypothetical protein
MTVATTDLTPIVTCEPGSREHAYTVDFRRGDRWVYPAVGRPDQSAMVGPDDAAPVYYHAPSDELKRMLEESEGAVSVELLKRFAFEYNRLESYTWRARGN